MIKQLKEVYGYVDDEIEVCSGIMGVPITFLDRYNPEQFEIVGMAHGDAGVELGLKPYDRSLKVLNKGLRDGDLYYMQDGIPILPYRRILIKVKQVKLHD